MAATAPKLEFPYGTVERTLAVAYGIPDSARETTFRAWLGSLQKAGLLGQAARVGRGKTLRYRPDHLHRLIFALEMSELGAPPAITLALIRDYWVKRIEPIFANAEVGVMHSAAGDGDVVIYFAGSRLRSGPLSGGDALPDIKYTTLAEMPAALALALEDAGTDAPVAPRIMAVNLSARLRIFHDALAADWLDKTTEADLQAPKEGDAA